MDSGLRRLLHDYAHGFAMKSKRLLIVVIALALAAFFYLVLRGSDGRLNLPAGPHVPMVSLGDSHGLVLAADGSMWSWGGQDRGWPVLGLGKTNLTANLIRIGSETNWTFISAGDDHNLALKSDGTIWAWGANYRGQLGDGNKGMKLKNGTLNLRDQPVHTVEGSDWVQVEAGSVCSYALKRDGTLWSWGLNNFSQLGTGSWTDSPKAAQVGTATNWSKIRAGGVSAAGIRSDGSLWIWGGSPKLGNTTPLSGQNLLVPTCVTGGTNWIDVSVAFNLWLAIKSDGTLWAWGRNAHMFTGTSPDACATPTQVGHDTDWQSVSASRGGSYNLLKRQNGSFWALDASQGDHTSVKLTRVKLPASVVAFGAGGGATAAITGDGAVWTCGTILGQHGATYRFLQFAEEQCWRMGWKVQWTPHDRTRIVQEQPRQLRNIDPDD
jgi:alpha-tubulin suppressor-like RCC1 family protein